MSSVNQYGGLRYPLGVIGLIAVAFLLRAGLALILERLAAGSNAWLPLFGTYGQTALIYSWAVSLFTFVLVPTVAFWFGMRYGQRPR